MVAITRQVMFPYGRFPENTCAVILKTIKGINIIQMHCFLHDGWEQKGK